MADDPLAGTGFEQGQGRITTNPGSDGSQNGYQRSVILNAFLGFGYYPTESELDSLIPTAAGTGGYEQGISAVANYVNQQKSELKRQQDDPLGALRQKLSDSIDLYKTQVQGLYGQLQDTLTQAPQLFGNLTPDQIQTYLAPLQTSFNQQLSQVQSIIGSRGLAASSTENAALAQTNQQFQQQALSTGLDVGMASQRAKASAIQNQINSLLGLTGQEESLLTGSTQQTSSQNLGQSNLLASLPYFLQQSALQNQMVQAQLNSGPSGFMKTFGDVTSGINQGVGALQSLMMVPQQFKSYSPSAPQTPAMPFPSASNPYSGFGYPGYSSVASAGSTDLTPALSLLQ